MPTWQQLRDVRLNEYTDAADGWGKVSSRSNADKDRVDNGMFARIHDTQKGETATEATHAVRQLSRNYQYLHTECGLVRTALNGLASELAAPQKKLKQALEDAENLKFTVKPDGSVEYPTDSFVLSPGSRTAEHGAPVPLAPGKGEGVGSADANKGKAEDIAQRIGDAVREAAEIDGRYAAALRRLKAGPGLDVSDADLVDAAADTKALQQAAGKYADDDRIPHGKSAKENAAWWNGLSQEQRDEYATLYPASVGALDGIPSSVRDDANRTVFAENRAQILTDLNKPAPNQYVPNPNGSYPAAVLSPEYKQWQKDQERLKEQLKGSDSIQARFDATGKEGLPEAYLLGYDKEGIGRAIIANGNPDTADHTAVYVPGTTTNLKDFDGNIKRMTETWLETSKWAPGQNVSTITWFGYEAPQSIAPDAMQKEWAHNGSPQLLRFMDGLETVQGGADNSHTTIIGHSYGSTVVGDASNKGDLAADDIVAVGSPGMLTGKAEDLDVGKDHVWSEAAWNDVVPAGGKVAGLGGHTWGVETWNGIPFNAGYVQTVPSDELFGAHRMDVDTSGHSDYWTRDSESLKNQAKVVAGRYDKVNED
ncbi:alpha/beta hydrolase [Streptomyces sp. NPDC012693]|uniref:alpha/beta hydrolase n=1 Tax=unclassified Streptomyces TaxID=2593676 RepID=UPI00202FCE38|nr:alpha/beta hydrolase [Streptomyces sp. MSC1_001]